MVWVRPPAALRLATISARIASTAPSRPFGAPQARPGRAARGTPASGRGGAERTGRGGGCQENGGPADRSFRRTPRTAPAESEVRRGPRPPTLRPPQPNTREAGPEALPPLSLPSRPA